jgi:hypothetical protein
MTETACQHCGRRIERDAEGRWIDPEATGDDSIWRETCDAHDTFMAEHEPETIPETEGYIGIDTYGHPMYEGEDR